MTPTPSDDNSILHWRSKAPQVRKVLAHIKKKGSITADELVEWDRTHGKQLFDWNNITAADDWRHHQARVFLNSFRAQFENMRVRGFIHIRKDDAAEIEESAYVDVESIVKHRGMRTQVVADIMRRIERLTSELRMWKLSATERQEFFERLNKALEDRAA